MTCGWTPQREHVGAGYAMAERLALVGERGVELHGRDVAALELGPGVRERVRRVDTTDEVGRQAAPALIGVERLERAGEDDATEVPQHRLEADGGGLVR
jgi:hypothetical protein